jgi:kynurenine formamidase
MRDGSGVMNKNRIIDISIPMDAFIFPSNPHWELEGPFNRVTGQNREYVYDFKLCTQSGTHIQGSHYFLKYGKKISEYPLDFFEGDAYIFDSDKRGIDISCNDLKTELQDVDLFGKTLIFRTGHMEELIEEKVLNKNTRPSLSLEAARYLCEEKGIRMIAIDSVGVESNLSENYDVNVYLCEKGILILECLANLALIKSKHVWIEAFPLKIQGVEGTPCRAIVKEVI